MGHHQLCHECVRLQARDAWRLLSALWLHVWFLVIIFLNTSRKQETLAKDLGGCVFQVAPGNDAELLERTVGCRRATQALEDEMPDGLSESPPAEGTPENVVLWIGVDANTAVQEERTVQRR